MNQYQVTSEEQKRKVSDVLAGNANDNIDRKKAKVEIPSEIEVSVSQKRSDGSNLMACVCNKKVMKLSETSEIAMIDVFMQSRSRGKAKI